jgi:hypothetical protein
MGDYLALHGSRASGLLHLACNQNSPVDAAAFQNPMHRQELSDPRELIEELQVTSFKMISIQSVLRHAPLAISLLAATSLLAGCNSEQRQSDQFFPSTRNTSQAGNEPPGAIISGNPRHHRRSAKTPQLRRRAALPPQGPPAIN